jgi:hypothetical protein
MHGFSLSAACAGAVGSLVASVAVAGPVGDQYRAGAFGLPWNASKAAIQAKYPGGSWTEDAKGRAEYCVASRQTLLKLPAQHQTKQLCFLMGSDGTLGSVTAHMDASLPALLAIVNRSRTTFGDFDSVRRDDSSIQARSTAMLWTRDAPYLVQVASSNDSDGRPLEVTFTVADEPGIHTDGAARVSHKPPGM